MISDLSFGFFLQGFDSLLLQSMFPMETFHGCCLAHQWCLPPMGTPHWPTRQLGLSREKGFETKFAPAETKGRIEASLFWFHTTVKSTALKGSPPQRRFMRTGSRALSINWAQICTTHPKKDQNIMSSPIKIPPYKKGKVKQKNFGWEFSREDPSFVSRRNGGLLRD